MLKKILIAIAISLLFASCEFFLETSSPINYLNYTIIDSPSEISQRAYKFAQLYEQEDTFYHWGGQEPLRSAIGIDCSGLVVMCYKYAMVDTGYKLIQEDMTAQNIHDYASRKINYTSARKGDLIFIGTENSKEISHIGIFEKYENGKIYFIDSSEGKNGVHYSEYPVDTKKIKGYGVMKIKY